MSIEQVPEAYLTPYENLPEWMHENIPPMPADERTERVEHTRKRLRNLITHEKTPVTDTQRVLKNTHERQSTMKIQTLELPMEHVGEYSRTPYALIISEVPQANVQRIMAATQPLAESEKPYTPEYVLVISDGVDTP